MEGPGAVLIETRTALKGSGTVLVVLGASVDRTLGVFTTLRMCVGRVMAAVEEGAAGGQR